MSDLKIDDPRASSAVSEPAEETRLLERRALRKLDYAILPVMTMFYLLSFLVCPPDPRRRERSNSCPSSRIAPTLVCSAFSILRAGSLM